MLVCLLPSAPQAEQQLGDMKDTLSLVDRQAVCVAALEGLLAVVVRIRLAVRQVPMLAHHASSSGHSTYHTWLVQEGTSAPVVSQGVIDAAMGCFAQSENASQQQQCIASAVAAVRGSRG
jgi:hypothetical protein